jgi:hypothetical protein
MTAIATTDEVRIAAVSAIYERAVVATDAGTPQLEAQFAIDLAVARFTVRHLNDLEAPAALQLPGLERAAETIGKDADRLANILVGSAVKAARRASMTPAEREAADRRAREACSRCGGSGQYQGMGDCFRCGGSGVDPKHA